MVIYHVNIQGHREIKVSTQIIKVYNKIIEYDMEFYKCLCSANFMQLP